MRRGRKVLTPEDLKLEAWTWSFSKFKQFQECTEKYRLHYLEKMKIPPLSQKPFFQGSVAHKVVERTRGLLDTGEVDSLRKAHDALEGVFNEYAVAISWRDDQELYLARAEAREILDNYLNLLEAQSLDEGEVLCEYWFGTHDKPLLRPSGLRLVGAIDWLKLDRENGRAWVYDAKTSKGTQYLDRRQLVLYAMAVKQVFGVEIEKVGYLMLRWEKPLLYDVTQAEIDALEQELIAASKLVEAGAMGALPSMKLCGPCQYAGHCGPYKGWIFDGGTSAEVEW
jgi:CRISPR/Cas system-associated exonuclease Cas4 (RecB family)